MRRSLDDARLVSLDALGGISVAAKIRIERNPRVGADGSRGRRRSATVTAGESLQTRAIEYPPPGCDAAAPDVPMRPIRLAVAPTLRSGSSSSPWFSTLSYARASPG